MHAVVKLTCKPCFQGLQPLQSENLPPHLSTRRDRFQNLVLAH